MFGQDPLRIEIKTRKIIGCIYACRIEYSKIERKKKQGANNDSSWGDRISLHKKLLRGEGL